jgi:hypothetical protein
MAIVSMTPAVAGNVALAAEYNKLITNITDLDSRTTAVEAAVGGGTGEVPRKGGEYLLTSQGSIGLGTLLTAWSANGTPSGVSHSSGVFTLTEAGLYVMTLNVRFTNSGTADRYIWICGSGSTDTWAKAGTLGASFNLSASVVRRVPAGQQVRCFAYYGTPSTTVGNENAGDEIPGFAIYKVGN